MSNRKNNGRRITWKQLVMLGFALLVVAVEGILGISHDGGTGFVPSASLSGIPAYTGSPYVQRPVIFRRRQTVHRAL